MESTSTKNDGTSNIQGNIPYQTRVVILNVLNFLTELKDPDRLKEVNFKKARDLTAMICGISVTTVDRIRKEGVIGVIKSPREQGDQQQIFQPPTGTYPKMSDKKDIKQIVSISQNMDSFVKHNITRIQGSFQQQSRIIINNVLNFLTELKDSDKLKELDFNKPIELTAMICGISVSTVESVDMLRNEGNLGTISPQESVAHSHSVTSLDESSKQIIQQIVSSFEARGENPQAKMILEVAKERIEGFKCSESSMKSILHSIGYKMYSRKGKKLGKRKMEDNDDTQKKRKEVMEKEECTANMNNEGIQGGTDITTDPLQNMWSVPLGSEWQRVLL